MSDDTGGGVGGSGGVFFNQFHLSSAIRIDVISITDICNAHKSINEYVTIHQTILHPLTVRLNQLIMLGSQ